MDQQSSHKHYTFRGLGQLMLSAARLTLASPHHRNLHCDHYDGCDLQLRDVDPYGHVLKPAVTPEGSPIMRVANLPIGSGNILYSKLGDWLGWCSLSSLCP